VLLINPTLLSQNQIAPKVSGFKLKNLVFKKDPTELEEEEEEVQREVRGQKGANKKFNTTLTKQHKTIIDYYI
jgi:hypothetical protein